MTHRSGTNWNTPASTHCGSPSNVSTASLARYSDTSANASSVTLSRIPSSATSLDSHSTTASSAHTPLLASSGSEATTDDQLLSIDWVCDECRQPIPPTEIRLHCKVCPDMDLHASCYCEAATPQSHSLSHDVQVIEKSFNIEGEKLLGVSDTANPTYTNGRLMRNIDTDRISGRRFVRLFNSGPKHVRHMVFDVPPGKYKVHVALSFRVSPHLNGVGQLKDERLGKLRVALGPTKDFQKFSGEAVPQSDMMICDLLSSGVMDDMDLKVPNDTPANSSRYQKSLTLTGPDSDGKEYYLDVEKGAVLGLLILWDDVREFQNPQTDGAVLDMFITGLR